MSVGEALAEARGAAGLSVDEVSERTRIREIVIRSIERDDFESLGGDLYVRGYLRAIAGAVGIDPKPLIREFDATSSNGSGGWSTLGTATATTTVAASAGPGPAAGPEAPQPGDPPAEADSQPEGEQEAAPAEVLEADAELESSAIWAQDLESGGDSWQDEAGQYAAEPEADAEAASASSASADHTWAEQGWTEPVATEAVWADVPPFAPADEPPAPMPADSPEAPTVVVASASRSTPPVPAVPVARSARHPGRPARPRTRVRGRRWVITISTITVVVLAVVGVAAAEIVSKLGSTSSAAAAAAPTSVPTAPPSTTAPPAAPAVIDTTPASKPSPTPSAKPPAPVRRLPIKADAAFGPDGLADGDNPQSASFAITSHASAPWQTNWYATADFGLLKHGTGLLLDMGKRVSISTVTIQLGGDGGASLQLRAGNNASLSQLPVVASKTNVGGLLKIRLAKPVTARYILIWFVKLPASGSGRYTASIYNVTVDGRP